MQGTPGEAGWGSWRQQVGAAGWNGSVELPERQGRSQLRRERNPESAPELRRRSRFRVLSGLRPNSPGMTTVGLASFRVPSPESRVPSPESRVPSPESRYSGTNVAI